MANKKDDSGKLHRLFRLVNLLASRKNGFMLSELIDATNSSRRTVYRDLKILEETGFDLQKTKNGRFFLSRSSEVSENLTFSKDEAELIRQALTSLPPESAAIIQGKISAHSETEKHLKFAVNAQRAKVFSKLSQAIREHKQVVLIDYHSNASASVSNRLVEPFGFHDQSSLLIAYELRSGQVKQYKIDRITDVKIEDVAWQYPEKHLAERQDAFGMLVKGDGVDVRLVLDEVSANLWKEERGEAGLSVLSQIGQGQFRLEGKFSSCVAIGRFVMGLPDHIRVEGNEALRQYLKDQVSLLKSRL